MTMNNPIKHKIHLNLLAIALATLLSGCGGGGGGSDATSSGAGSSGDAGEDATENVSQEVPESVARLDIDARNELETSKPLSIEVTTSSVRSFLSICPGVGAGVDVNTLNYDRCAIRVALDAGRHDLELTVPNHVDEMAAILWFFEAGREAQVSRWRRSGNKGAELVSQWRVVER